MFEQYADQLWMALFAAFIFYGVWLAVRAPFLVKKFYKKNNFTDTGKSDLNVAPYDQSLVLEKLHANSIYRGQYGGYQVEQFAAFPEDRHKFTLNKAKRKHNQSLWTVSIIHDEASLLQFCARPTTVTAAIGYVLDRDNVEFPDDDLFTDRGHVQSNDHAAVVDAFSTEVRAHLTGIDPLSLESVGGLLIQLAPRQPHDVGSKFQSDLDALIRVYELLSGKRPSELQA